MRRDLVFEPKPRIKVIALKMEVPSPCQNICILDTEMVCIGCGRTADEVSRWAAMSNEEKQAVLDRLEDEE